MRAERTGNLQYALGRLGQRCGLGLNDVPPSLYPSLPNLSAIARPQERKFLGFSFTNGPEVKRAIAPKALERFRKRIREITRRAKGVSIEATMAELVPYLRGWRGYFGFCETPEVLIGSSDGFVCGFELLCGGNGKPNVVVEQLCWNSGSAQGWRVTPLAVDLVPGTSREPKPFLSGFPMPTSNRLAFLHSSRNEGLTSRTAVYGPVRTVVFLWAHGPPIGMKICVR